MKDNDKKLFNMFAREIVSNKKYTDESVLDYIKDSDSVKYPNEKIIPVYPINPYDWLNKVSFSRDVLFPDHEVVIANLNNEHSVKMIIDKFYNDDID